MRIVPYVGVELADGLAINSIRMSFVKISFGSAFVFEIEFQILEREVGFILRMLFLVQ